MTRINYITNLNVHNFSGGWSGMNHYVHDQLSKQFDVHLIQDVNPRYNLSERVMSKALRLAGRTGNFPAFTRRRLNTIKQEVESRMDKTAQLNFYHGSTPWLHVENEKPYAIYLDCCFYSYITVYHNKEFFNSNQLHTLFDKEAAFLNDARWVFFSSQWALNDAKKSYSLNGNNFCVAGLGGGIQFETQNSSSPKPYFLFIGMDFCAKGGDVVAEAIDVVRKEYPEYSLKIAGQPPPKKYMAVVEYEGIFNKSDKGQLLALQKLFAEAYCFVLPTGKDMTPLVLLEASASGCPVIATNSFGIPEMIKNNETGILLDAGSPLKDQLVRAMKRMIADKNMRAQFAINAREYVGRNFNWERTGKIICERINESLAA